MDSSISLKDEIWFLRVPSRFKRALPTVKREEIISNGMSYIVLRGRWCNITVLNVHAPNEEKIDYSKNSFYE